MDGEGAPNRTVSIDDARVGAESFTVSLSYRLCNESMPLHLRENMHSTPSMILHGGTDRRYAVFLERHWCKLIKDIRNGRLDPRLPVTEKKRARVEVRDEVKVLVYALIPSDSIEFVSALRRG